MRDFLSQLVTLNCVGHATASVLFFATIQPKDSTFPPGDVGSEIRIPNQAKVEARVEQTRDACKTDYCAYLTLLPVPYQNNAKKIIQLHI